MYPGYYAPLEYLRKREEESKLYTPSLREIEKEMKREKVQLADLKLDIVDGVLKRLKEKNIIDKIEKLVNEISKLK